MELIKSSKLSESEKAQVLDLWNAEYPEQLTYSTIEEFENYVADLAEQSHILLKDENNTIKGWYFDFIRENEKWFVLILDAEVQGKGIGGQILDLAKQNTTCLNGWVIDHNLDKKKNGEIYFSPLSFYLKNGFIEIPSERLKSDKISAVKIRWVR